MLSEQDTEYYITVKLMLTPIIVPKHRKRQVRFARILHPNLKVLFFNVRMKLNTIFNKRQLRYLWWFNK